MDGWMVEWIDESSHGNNVAIWENRKHFFFWKRKEINDASVAQL